MPRPRVHVTGRVPVAVDAVLRGSSSWSMPLVGADGILAVLATTVDDAYLERAGSGLRVVANYAAGVNNIDLEAAQARGIVVANTPEVLTRTTAELAVALTLSLLRRVTEGDGLIRGRRAWEFSLEFMLGESLDGKTFGVVGPGKIGRETARLAACFGARPLFAGCGDALDELLATADVVSLHVPLLPETRHLIDAAALARMRPSAVLVNTSRGPVVDEAALVAALRDGVIAGAALDVFEFEPTYRRSSSRRRASC